MPLDGLRCALDREDDRIGNRSRCAPARALRRVALLLAVPCGCRHAAPAREPPAIAWSDHLPDCGPADACLRVPDEKRLDALAAAGRVERFAIAGDD